MSKLLLFLLGLLLFFGLGYWCLNKTTAPKMQNDINTRVTQSLHAAHFDSVKAQVDGRDITLTGSVISEQQRVAVEQAAKVHGFRVIENQVVVDSAASETNRGYFLEIKRDKANKVVLKGYVPDAVTHHNLVSFVIKSFGSTDITDHLEEKQNPPDNWISIIRTGVNSLQQLDNGQLTITDMEMTLAGESSNQLIKENITNNFTSSQVDGYKKSLDIVISQSENLAKNLTNSEDASKNLSDTTNCHNKLNKLIANLSITFKSGSTEVTTPSATSLDMLAKIKKECPNQLFDINGHTDSRGDSRLNLILSEKRANAVKKYLISKGASSQKIIAKGFGETSPIADNKTLSGQKKNRRIEIIVRDPKQ